MWESIRAFLKQWSILITGLVLIVGGMYVGTHVTSQTNSAPAATSDQAKQGGQSAASSAPSPQSTTDAKQANQKVAQSTKAPSPPPAAQASPEPSSQPRSNGATLNQARDQGGQSAASSAPNPQPAGEAKQPSQQVAQSTKASSPPPAAQPNPAPSPQPSAAPMVAASPAPSAHDHVAASSTAPASGTTGQSPQQSNAAQTAGDAGAGRLVFRKCQACHSIEPGKNLLGPSLSGVIGRKAGAEAGFNYSPAMKSADIVWNPETLDKYLADPAKVVPGNKMPFPGLKTDHDRADVIAFLAGGGKGAATAAPPSQPRENVSHAPGRPLW